jgi:acylphosphatase
MFRAKQYLIRGRVQGVGYRYFALQAAERHGIRGFVRNLVRGDVEVQAEAEEDALESFKQELGRGPRMSRVTEIAEKDLPVSGLYSSFTIR